MNNFNWYNEKQVLKATLNACIRNGLTYEQTKQALFGQFSASCNVCCIANMGQTVCTKKRKCYVEAALDTYLKVAKEKCMKDEEN